MFSRKFLSLAALIVGLMVVVPRIVSWWPKPLVMSDTPDETWDRLETNIFYGADLNLLKRALKKHPDFATYGGKSGTYSLHKLAELRSIVPAREDSFHPKTNFPEEAVKLLIANGADPNALDSNGETPLFQAAVYGDFRLAKALIEHGADVNFRKVNKTL